MAELKRKQDETLQDERDRLYTALRAIAGMSANDDTDHAQLSALCIAIARCEVETRYRSGKTCIEPGCDRPSGTPWGPYWCFVHDTQRLNAISISLKEMIHD